MVIRFVIFVCVTFCSIFHTAKGLCELFWESEESQEWPQWNNDTFPPWFKFGASTSAYQIEGGWNQNGKGPNIWDTYTHDYPWLIKDHSNGDIACDSYHQYPEDIALATYMGINFYRFSISWARVLPYGYINDINEPGIDYYNRVIDSLLAKNITPMVTIYHWDLPQALQNIGGWPNPLLVDIYADYARLLFDRFGDRVKYWLTFNEAKHFCGLGYGTWDLAPGYVNQSGIADYMCGYTVLLAHAKVYHMYQDEYKSKQKGLLAMTIDTTWYAPARDTEADREAQFTKLMFSFGWFANPIFIGNWPQVMIDRVGNRSKAEGFSSSRLPAFTPEQIEYIKGTADFLSLNMYTSALVEPAPPSPKNNIVSYWNDIGVKVFQPASWPNTSYPGMKVCPWGAKDLLVWIKENYGDLTIIITENGYADRGTLHDERRIIYYREYLNDILQAMTLHQVNVIGYAVWSLIDNFEWTFGYTEKFGVNFVNFTNPARPRKIKDSARCYKKLIKSRQIDWDCTGQEPESYFDS